MDTVSESNVCIFGKSAMTEPPMTLLSKLTVSQHDCPQGAMTNDAEKKRSLSLIQYF